MYCGARRTDFSQPCTALFCEGNRADEPPPSTAPAQLASEVVGTANGLVFVIGENVALEVPDFGRVEFAPDIAEKVARALNEGAALVRKSRPKQIVTLL